MIKRASLLLSILILLFSCSSSENSPTDSSGNNSPSQGTSAEQFLGAGSYDGVYWPTTAWQTCDPELVGMDSDELLEVYEYAANPQTETQAVIIIKDGYIVGEAYFGTFTADTRHESYSMAKSFSSCLTGIAIDQGLITDVDDTVCQYVEEWDCADGTDPRRNITLKHLMTLTSGLDWHEDWSDPSATENDAILMGQSADRAAYVLEKPCVYEPGTVSYYSTGDPAILTKIICEATGMPAHEFAMKNLFEIIGVTNIQWNIDAAGNTTTYAGIQATVREYAKFGYLYLNDGLWENTQVVSEDWVAISTSTGESIVPWYGYLWHVYLSYRLNALGTSIPDDGYMAEGINGQKIFVLPSNGLVIVRLAMDSASTQWDDTEFLLLILNSIL